MIYALRATPPDLDARACPVAQAMLDPDRSSLAASPALILRSAVCQLRSSEWKVSTWGVLMASCHTHGLHRTGCMWLA